MNQVVLSGRLCDEPETRYTQGENPTAVARYRLAVSRYKSTEADFINCVAFGKGAEFAGKYLHKGVKILITGRIQTGSYKNKEGQTVYTTSVVVESHEFCEPKREETNNTPQKGSGGGFSDIPAEWAEELPFQ